MDQLKWSLDSLFDRLTEDDYSSLVVNAKNYGRGEYTYADLAEG